MRKNFVIFALICGLIGMTGLFIGSRLSAQQRTAVRSKVGCVDINRVFQSSPWYADAQSQLQRKRTDIEVRRRQIEGDITLMEEQLASNYILLTDYELSQRTNAILQRKLELLEYIDNSQRELSQKEEEIMSPILRQIRQAIQAVAIQYDYSMIIDKATYIIWVDDRYDITDDVIHQIDWMQGHSSEVH